MLKVLVVEDNPGDVRLLEEMLAGEREAAGLVLTAAGTLGEALQALIRDPVEVVLLDLNLPDSQGLETLMRLRDQVPGTPVVVLTGLDDDALGMLAVKAGAQDYLVKGQVTGPLLVRSVHYAMERHRMQAIILNLSLMDDLTGLYNRRGFLTLGDQQWKMAGRTKQPLSVLMADINRMKWINDTYGHLEGDRALKATAQIIREVFRRSDIVARIGGDEFAVLLIDAGAEHLDRIMQRLRAGIEAYNRRPDRLYDLSLGIGTSLYQPNGRISSLEELLACADSAMYRDKGKNQLTTHEPPTEGKRFVRGPA